MKPLIVAPLLLAVLVAEAGAVTIPTVPVGNGGNAGDIQPFGTYGAVAYDYRIGTTEVTNAQYAAFLNAVAADDTFALYNSTFMPFQGGITRNGLNGSYTYAVMPGMANQPVNYVNVFDAIRFTNWLHNGQPTGPQDSHTTEDGAYTIGMIVGPRNENATWCLPNDDEWYKAAYHKNDGVTGNYWNFPTSTDAFPNPGPPPGGTNAANVLGSGVGTLTDAGAYVQSPSPYGTLDQAGNVSEWNESSLIEWRLRGGSFQTSSSRAHAAEVPELFPLSERRDVGFRVAMIPEPSTIALAACGIAAMLCILRRRNC